MVKYPGPLAAFLTISYASSSVIVIFGAMKSHNWGVVAVATPLILACSAIWFEFRPARFVILPYLIALSLNSIATLIEGFQLSILAKGIVHMCGVYVIATWKTQKLATNCKQDDSDKDPLDQASKMD